MCFLLIILILVWLVDVSRYHQVWTDSFQSISSLKIQLKLSVDHHAPAVVDIASCRHYVSVARPALHQQQAAACFLALDAIFRSHAT